MKSPMRVLTQFFAADAAAADLHRSRGRISRLVAALRPERATGWLDHVDDAGERFEVAAAQYGQTDANLRDALRGLYRQFSIYYTAALLFMATVIVGPVHGLSGLAAAAPTAALITLAARAGFYHYQIRTRRLARVAEWLRQPGEWLPLSGAASNPKRMILSLLILLLSAAPAAAATTAVAQDAALNVINTLLPFASGAGSTTTTLSTALFVMSATLTGFVGAALAYQVISATVAAAHEGKMLSGRYHGVWMPIRTVTSFGMTVPVVAGGFSAIHLLIYQLAIGSNTLANSTWAAYVNATLGAAPVAATAPGIPPSVGGADMAEKILRNEICASTTLAAEASESAASGMTYPSSAALPASGGVAVVDTRGATTAQAWSYDWSCGGYSIPIPAVGAPAPLAAFSTARISAVSALVSAVRGADIAQQAANWATLTGGSPDFPSGIQAALTAAGQAYDQAMISAAATLTAAQNADVRSRLTAAASTGGWTTAFSMDRALAQASQQTAQAASQSPAWIAPKADPSSHTGHALKELDEELHIERGAGVLTADDLAAAGQSGDGYITRLLEPIDHRIALAIIDFSAADPTDPVGDLMNLGAKLSAAGEAGVGVAIGLATPAGTVIAKAAGLDVLFETVLKFASPVIWGALAAGWTLQFLLPMMVWIAGLWLIVGWVISTIEVIICATIWSVLLAKLDGQELLDSIHKPFLSAVAAWFFRPTLGILSFIAYRLSVSLVFSFLSSGFSTAYVGSQGGHFVGLIGTIGGVLLLSWLSWQMMLRLTGIIHSLPNRVSEYLGLGAPSSGDSDSHLRTIAGAVVSGKSGGQLGGDGRGGGGKGPGSGGGKKPPGGGGGAPGVKPVGLETINDGSSGSGGTDSGDSSGSAGGGTDSDGGGQVQGGWMAGTGGYAGLSPEMQASAEKSFDKIHSNENDPRAQWANDLGLVGYVDYVQEKASQQRDTVDD